MQKIPTALQRDPDDMSRVLDEPHPACGWVFAGEGVATRKYDGTCVAYMGLHDVDDPHWYARREVKPGKTPPPGWWEVDHDETTGKRVGWEPIALSPFWHAHSDALFRSDHDKPDQWAQGTYELIGPKVNGNPERVEHHQLVAHADAQRIDTDGTPREVEGVKALVLGLAEDHGWEGIVWHHPDGRMAKLKARDLR